MEVAESLPHWTLAMSKNDLSDFISLIAIEVVNTNKDMLNIQDLSNSRINVIKLEKKAKETSRTFIQTMSLMEEYIKHSQEELDELEMEIKQKESLSTAACDVIDSESDDEVMFLGASFDPNCRLPTMGKRATPSLPADNCSQQSPLSELLSTQNNVVNRSLHGKNAAPSASMIILPEIKTGSEVFIKKSNDIWYPGIVKEVIKPESCNQVSEWKYRVRLDAKSQKVVTGFHVAYHQSVCEQGTNILKVGARVIALYKENDLPQISSYYAGIVAEAPSLKNQRRFLVFFDDGYAQYCWSKEIYKVYYQSRNVWEDIRKDSQHFIRKYLRQYPERPMVRLLKDQVVKTEWNGSWWTGKVVEVDASLVKMFFISDNRSEWIYRGSARLQPLFNALANAEPYEHPIANQDRSLNASNKRRQPPLVEYVHDVGVAKKANVSTGVATTWKQSKRAVARKSTAPTEAKHPKVLNCLVAEDASSGNVEGWEPPWVHKMKCRQFRLNQQKLHQDLRDIAYSKVSERKSSKGSSQDMASVLHERLTSTSDPSMDCGEDAESLGERLSTIIDKDVLRKNFAPHSCEAVCVAEQDEDMEKHHNKNPFSFPLFCNWERQICKVYPGGKRCVMYRAPCGRRLRSMDEVDRYLSITDSQLFIDYFCFDPWLHVHTEFVPMKTFCYMKDMSYGKEAVHISCVNAIDRQYPDYVEYASYRIPSKYPDPVEINLDPEFLQCCDCTDNCRDRSKCSCQQLTVENTSWTGDVDQTAGYCHRRLKEPIFSGVVECNSRCKCDRRCRNRVAQNGLSCRLQVFKTENRGWGIRCLHDIPKGAFICIYVGQLLTDMGANNEGKQYGDEYLAELDFIEVAESRKQGYESDVEDPDYLIDNNNGTDEEDDENAFQCENIEGSTGSEDNLACVENLQSVGRNYGTRSRTSVFGKKDITGSIKPSTVLNPQIEHSLVHGEQGEYVDSKGVDSNIGESGQSSKRAVDEKELSGHDEICSRTSDGCELRDSDSFNNTVVSENKVEAELEQRARLGTRALFKDKSSCYIMDAKSMGNIGRYLNHSCSPNVFVQNIFVDTHDLRFPWVAFFANQYIRAGVELTWDYNYEVGSVPGKVLFCYCGTSKCRGRLL